MPKVEEREKSLRERRVEDADRRLVDEVAAMSIRDAGLESSLARSERTRRENDSSSQSTRRASRERSRDDHHSEGRNRRRRDTANENRPHLDTLRPDAHPSQDRRRRRSAEDARRRHEEASRRAARHVEHQSSLRSLISSNDGDSEDMQEEIFRQIQEEGLLDGVDIENITPAQQEEIRQKIADAYLRRQREQIRQAARSTVSPPTAAENSTTSRSSSRHRRTHSRSASTTSQADEHVRRTVRTTSSQLDIRERSMQSPVETDRRRRGTSSVRSSTGTLPLAPELVRTADRATTMPFERPRSSQTPSDRPPISLDNNRRGTSPHTPSRPNTSPSSQPTRSELQQPTRQAPGLPPRTNDESEGVNAPEALPLHQADTPAGNIMTAETTSVMAFSDSPDANGQTFSFPDDGLIPAPLATRHVPSLSDRATAMGSAIRPISQSGSVSPRVRPQTYPEPAFGCSRCGRSHIEYEVHYNCNICSNGNWNMCLDCYRNSKGCLHWFGFGKAAWIKFDLLSQRGEIKPNADRPHMLTANRYTPPYVPEGGADSRRTVTTEDPRRRLQSGCFCSNCLAWTNHCYWKCDTCNDDEWGFCNDCVNQGKCCTHALLPLTYRPDKNGSPPATPTTEPQAPPTATVLRGPNVMSLGPFKPLTFRVSCDVCHVPIPPTAKRHHCYECESRSVSTPSKGDYDICLSCYASLQERRRISVENGSEGWRRCLRGHRMVIIAFTDTTGAQRRIVHTDLVGGYGVKDEGTVNETSDKEVMIWSWAEGTQRRYVSRDVSDTALAITPAPDPPFPSDGGTGLRVLAVWSWYPKGNSDELLFPRGAEVRECVDINGDWFVGAYMGVRKLFPAPYVRVLL